MTNKSLMLDSGAFSVWSRGKTVDLEAYITFCEEHPDCDSFVNLDVIPGRPDEIRTLSRTAIEEACLEGWKNYHKMIERLPKDKVIPVFHQGDNFDWLRRMIDSGAPYIGISPANDRTTKQRRNWLMRDSLLDGDCVRKIITNSRGDPIVKTHGFAVTSNTLMSIFPWYSVDSATWGLSGGHGNIFVPVPKGDGWDYSADPWIISVSDRSPNKKKRGMHIESLSVGVRRALDKYLKEEGLCLGKSIVRDKKPGDKINKGIRWANREKTQVIEIIQRGIQTDDQRRKWLNIRYFQRTNEALDLEKIFIAGGGTVHKLEKEINHRLLSYLDVEKKGSVYRKIFMLHYGGNDENQS